MKGIVTDVNTVHVEFESFMCEKYFLGNLI